MRVGRMTAGAVWGSGGIAWPAGHRLAVPAPGFGAGLGLGLCINPAQEQGCGSPVPPMRSLSQQCGGSKCCERLQPGAAPVHVSKMKPTQPSTVAHSARHASAVRTDRSATGQ